MRTRPFAGDDLEPVSKIMQDGELECTPEYIRKNLPDGVVLEDAGRVIGFCGLIPCHIWVGKETKDAFQLGMLGMENGHGAAFMSLLDGVRSRVGDRFVYANTANKKGAKVWKMFYGMKPGPVENSVIRYKLIIPFLGCAKSDRVERSERWMRFVEDLRESNDGLMTERSIEGWLRLEATCVTVIRDGKILGAAFLRRRPKLPRYDIVDICAVGHERGVIEELLNKCCKIVAQKGGLILEYVGSPTGMNDVFDKILSHRRPAVSNTFVYDGKEDVTKGWFFGPYDGDRCIS